MEGRAFHHAHSLIMRGKTMEFETGTIVQFFYVSQRSGIRRTRRVQVEEMKETGRGLRLIATPLDSESGRDGVRTFNPAFMSDVRVLS